MIVGNKCKTIQQQNKRSLYIGLSCSVSQNSNLNSINIHDN